MKRSRRRRGRRRRIERCYSEIYYSLSINCFHPVLYELTSACHTACGHGHDAGGSGFVEKRTILNLVLVQEKVGT